MKKHTWKIISGIALLLLGASVVYSQQVSQKANEGVVVEAHIKGNPDSSVTLTEYSDFECPACGQFYPYIKDILNEHGDSIRFEYKHFPLITIHRYAMPAAQAAEAAGQQGEFYAMHDMLFENQSAWSKASSPDAFFIKYAEEIGLDVPLFKSHLNSSVITDSIKESFSEAQKLGLTGTPSFYLNGEMMTFTTYEDFTGQIEQAIAGAGDNTNTESEVSEETPSATTTVTEEASIKFGI